MEWLTPEIIFQCKDFLSLLALVWLLYWTYRHFVPNLVEKLVNAILEIHKDNEKD